MQLFPFIKEASLAADRDYFRDPQPVQMQQMCDREVYSPSWYIYNTTPTTQVSGNTVKEEAERS